MWYSGRKARKEGGKIKRCDQHTGFLLSRTFVSSSGQWQKKIVFFFQNFSTYDVNTYERSLQVLTADKSDYWSVLSLIFISPPHNVIAFFSSIWAGLGAMLLWNSYFQRPPPPRPLEISLVTCHDLHDYLSWGQIYPRKTHLRI